MKAEELGVEIYPGFAASEVSFKSFLLSAYQLLDDDILKLHGGIFRYYMIQQIQLLALELMTWE